MFLWHRYYLHLAVYARSLESTSLVLMASERGCWIVDKGAEYWVGKFDRGLGAECMDMDSVAG